MADTVATLRPNGVNLITGFTVTGAADAATALSDNADTSWVNGSGGSVIVDTTTVAIPALAQIRSVTPRGRSKPGGVIVNTNFEVYLSGSAGPANVFTPPDNTNIYNYSGGALTTRPTDGAAWTQADIDALQWRAAGAGTNYYEAYLDVAYNQAPVAVMVRPARTVTDGVTNSTTTVTSATAAFSSADIGYSISGAGIPAGATIVSVTNATTIVISAAATATASGVTLVFGAAVATNTPTIIWSYNDPESDAQERYRVKVFTAAQAAIGGFNPETSPNTYDSGEVFSSGQTAVSGALATNTTYVAYVKVADAGSSGRYGNWAGGTAFTVAGGGGLLLDLPASPNVTVVTADQANNRAAVTVQGIDNELTRNQSSFETSLLGWEVSINVTTANLTRDTTKFLHGSASMKMVSTAAGDMAARTVTATAATAATGFQNALVPVLAGLTYTALASFLSAVSARSCRVDIRWYNSTGTLLSTSTGTTAADNTSTWTQVVCTAAAPAGAAYAGLVVTVLATGAAAEAHWVDEVDIGPGTSTLWTRGGFVNNQGRLLDTFSRADNAATQGISEGPLFPGWTPAVGTWGVIGGRSYLASATATAVSYLQSSVIADGVMTCDVTLSSTPNRANCGLVLKAFSTNLYLLVQLVAVSGTNALQLQRDGSGTFTVLATSNPGLVAGATYGVKVEFFGALIRVYLDKKDGAGYTKWIDFTLSTADMALFGSAAANNGYGLWVNNGGALDDGGARFDNFAVNQENTQTVVAQRSLDGGSTWATVRSINKVPLNSPGQQSTFLDYEAPRGRSITYRAFVVATESDVTLTGTPGTTLALATLPQDGNAWLKSPVDPTKNVAVNLVKDSANSSSTEDQVVFAPLGRADYLIHGGTVRLEVFDGLQFLFATDAAYQAFEALRQQQSPLLLQTCYGDPGGVPEEFWIRMGPARTTTRYTMSTAPGQLRMVKVPAHQVLAPVVS